MASCDRSFAATLIALRPNSHVGKPADFIFSLSRDAAPWDRSPPLLPHVRGKKRSRAIRSRRMAGPVHVTVPTASLEAPPRCRNPLENQPGEREIRQPLGRPFSRWPLLRTLSTWTASTPLGTVNRKGVIRFRRTGTWFGRKSGSKVLERQLKVPMLPTLSNLI